MVGKGGGGKEDGENRTSNVWYQIRFVDLYPSTEPSCMGWHSMRQWLFAFHIQREKGESCIFRKITGKPHGFHPRLPRFCLPRQKGWFLSLLHIFLSVEAVCASQLTMKIGAMNLPTAEAVIFENKILANTNDVELKQTFLVIQKEIPSPVDRQGLMPVSVQSQFCELLNSLQKSRQS